MSVNREYFNVVTDAGTVALMGSVSQNTEQKSWFPLKSQES